MTSGVIIPGEVNEDETPASESVTPPTTVRAALDAAIDRFIKRNARSSDLHKQAVEKLPGGNTRTQMHTAPFPVYMKSGAGYQVISEDGHTYTDFVGEVTVAVYGHSNPVIREAMITAFDHVGLNLGATTIHETALADALCSRFKLDKVRFTNSGTEATLHALVAVRAFTKKRKIVVFGGGYHGGVMLFGGGRPGVNNVDQDDWIVARYNDLDSAEEAISRSDVAAVLLEALQGVAGVIPGTREFLHGVEAAARDAGVLVVLDEVMTSRLAPGGLASAWDLKPDITTFGKYLGGGLTFGAFGGRADVMSVFDPRLDNFLPHSGTFQNNTMALIVGHAAMSKIYTPEVCVEFNTKGTIFLSQLVELTLGTKLCFTGVGSIIGSHFTELGLQKLDRETPEVKELKDLFWYEMMEEGFWMLRDGRIALILGTPQSELDRYVASVKAFLNRHSNIVKAQ